MYRYNSRALEDIAYKLKHNAYNSTLKKCQSFIDFYIIWEYACDFEWNKIPCRKYNELFAKRAFETRNRSPTRRSYFDNRSKYLHIATLEEMWALGYSAIIDDNGNLRIIDHQVTSFFLD